MDTKHLEYFQIVYEEKSIHAAAKKLFISPQGLGKIIQNLESEFGASFFTRTKSGVVATESGTFFYKYCIKMIQDIQFLRSHVGKTANTKPSLQIGFAIGTLQLFPLDILHKFMAHYKDIHVHWCEYPNQALIQAILSSEIDYGFVVGETHHENLAQILRCVCPVVLLVYEEHPLYHKDVISLDMLRNENLILMNEAFQIYHDFTAACQINGFQPNIIAKTMDGGTLYRLCSEKIGLAVTPHFPIQDSLHVKAIPLTGDYTWEIYGTFRKAPNTNSACGLLNAFLDERLPCHN